jgi:hypothetical protein
MHPMSLMKPNFCTILKCTLLKERFEIPRLVRVFKIAGPDGFGGVSQSRYKEEALGG